MSILRGEKIIPPQYIKVVLFIFTNHFNIMEIFNIIYNRIQELEEKMPNQDSVIQQSKQNTAVMKSTVPQAIVVQQPTQEMTRIIIKHFDDILAVESLKAQERTAALNKIVPILTEDVKLLYTVSNNLAIFCKEKGNILQEDLVLNLKKVGELVKIQKEREKEKQDIEASAAAAKAQLNDVMSKLETLSQKKRQLDAEIDEFKKRYEINSVGDILNVIVHSIEDTFNMRVIELAKTMEEIAHSQREKEPLEADALQLENKNNNIITVLSSINNQLTSCKGEQEIIERKQKVIAAKVSFAIHITDFYNNLKELIAEIAQSISDLDIIKNRLNTSMSFYTFDGSEQKMILREALLELSVNIDKYLTNNDDLHSSINTPSDADMNRFAILYDGSTYRLYCLKAGSHDTLYQFGWNGSAYAYGHNSIPEIKIKSIPADADINRFAMLHDGNTYRFYCFKAGSTDTLYQFAWDGGTYTYGHNSIPEVKITGIPADADMNRFTMLHDGSAYRFYCFKKDSRDIIYQFAWDGSTYAYTHSSVPQISAKGLPTDTNYPH